MLHTIVSGKTTLSNYCALVYNLTDIYGLKRAVIFSSREGSDRRTPVATLPNLISAVFGIPREPTLESRLSAVSFGILVVAKQLFTTNTFTKKDQNNGEFRSKRSFVFDK